MCTAFVQIQQKLNIPAILRAPKERKPSKKEGGTQKTSTLPAVLYRQVMKS